VIIDWTRTALELLGEAMGHIERAADIEAHGGIIDQRDVPLAHRPKRKWYTQPREFDDVTAFCVHITAVRGGFGARKSDIAKHVKRGLDREKAVTHAQADRFLAVPYHDISARSLVRNLPAEVVSWHGRRCNRYSLGYAIDMASGDAFDLDLEQVRFDRVIRERRRECPGIRWIEAHRQHSAMRGGDPGAKVFRALLDVANDHGIEARPTHTTGTGRPLPADWLDLGRV
jgi:hypothetical protein